MAWGSADIPVLKEIPHAFLQDVVALSITYRSGLALHRDGSLTTWGSSKALEGFEQNPNRLVTAIHLGATSTDLVFYDSEHVSVENDLSRLLRSPARRAGASDYMAAARLPDRNLAFMVGRSTNDYCARIARGCTQLIYVKPYSAEGGRVLGVRPKSSPPSSGTAEKGALPVSPW